MTVLGMTFACVIKRRVAAAIRAFYDSRSQLRFRRLEVHAIYNAYSPEDTLQPRNIAAAINGDRPTSSRCF